MNTVNFTAKYAIGDVLKVKMYNRESHIIVKGICCYKTAEGDMIEYEPTEENGDYVPESSVIGRMVLETEGEKRD